MLSENVMRNRLIEPSGRVNMVLDTDTFNEIDDQFALTLAVLSPGSINLKAVTAAPFSKQKTTPDPAVGMELSYDEIIRVLSRLNAMKDDFVFKGATTYLKNKNTPVESAAAQAIIRCAHESDEPLYVTAIGAITNVASALIMDPDIIEKIVVVWLGGQPYYWPSAGEYNLGQDVMAAQHVFDCGVPVIHVPCKNVAEHVKTTAWELEKYVKGRGAVGDFLFKRFCEYSDNLFGWSKEIWDMAPIAWLIKPEWVPSQIMQSPILTDDMTWETDSGRHLCRCATDVRRDPVFRDFFTKLEKFSNS